jgi:hypothetical protein
MVADSRSSRPLGLLTLLISLPIIEAAGMAAVAFIQEGEPIRATISVVATASALLLLAAGVLLLTRRRFGRVVAQWGAAGSIVSHILGALIGLVGGHGVLYGAAFPIALLLLFRATPSPGVPHGSDDARPRRSSVMDRTNGQLRAATV